MLPGQRPVTGDINSENILHLIHPASLAATTILQLSLPSLTHKSTFVKSFTIKMKFAAFFLSLIPAAFAAECVRYGGCSGCSNVDNVSFTQNGSTYTAISPAYGSMSMNETTLSVENYSDEWLLFCVYASVCVPLGAGDSCSADRISTDYPTLGLQVWAQ